MSESEQTPSRERLAPPGRAAGRLLVVYDGACGFCRASIEEIRRRDRRNRFDFLPRETPGLEAAYPQLNLVDFDSGLRLIDARNNVYIGADAIYQIVRQLPYYHWFAWTYHLPVIHALTRRAYAWVAAHRMELLRSCEPGSTCRLEPVTGSGASDAGAGQGVASASAFHRWGLSILILVIIALQLNTFIVGSKYWPFMVYSMYRESEPPRVIHNTRFRTFALTRAGKRLDLSPPRDPKFLAILRRPHSDQENLVGLKTFAMTKYYLKQIRAGDRAAAARLAERINVSRTDPVTSFEIESEKFVITPKGVESQGKKVTKYPLED